MKKFIIKRKDGGISLGIVCEENMNLDDEVKKWKESSQLDFIYYQFEDRIPTDPDGYFHDAYDHNEEQGLFIDMDKARHIHMDHLRLLRSQKFIELGFPFRFHPQLEEKLFEEEIKNKLKMLRDIPQNFDLSFAKNPDELRKLIPELLKKDE